MNIINAILDVKMMLANNGIEINTVIIIVPTMRLIIYIYISFLYVDEKKMKKNSHTL